MNTDSDTIAAIATAPGEAGIAIVRVSGPASLQLADRVFRCGGEPPSRRPPNTFVHGFVRSGSAAAGPNVDEGILLIFRAPHSYTREDAIEIHGHGGRVPAARILCAVLDAGARLSEPGEFTRRAFLNGRIDLMQAEAVCDLIRSTTDRAASAALEQLEGVLSHSFTRIYSCLLSTCADIEASLDFESGELPTSTIQEMSRNLSRASEEMRRLLGTWNGGHVLREGALVVISGRPNVGKSTLMNRLLGKDRAIVTDIPGTTRDMIEEQLIVDGVLLRLVDTAGLRDSECQIEREGMRRARLKIGIADVNLRVVDASQALHPDDRREIARMSPDKSVFVLNKQDLGSKVVHADFPDGATVVDCCLLEENGAEPVKPAVIGRLGVCGGSDGHHASISERHRQILEDVRAGVDDAMERLRDNDERQLVLAASSLKLALNALGQATGRIYTNEILDAVFNKFCVGK